MSESRCYVGSEIGPLKRVLLHRPDLSIKRLTPSNTESLLFDDVLRTEQAGREHDYFSQLLRNEGVEVLLLKSLLDEVLQINDARKWLLSHHCSPYYLGPILAEQVQEFLCTKNPDEISNFLLGGITFEEMNAPTRSLVNFQKSKIDFILPPLPNHMFTRDTSCWIYDGVSINPMAKAARMRETITLHSIYHFHPIFTKSKFNYWLDNIDGNNEMISLEGGDVLVIGDGLILIGISERTTPQAIELLASKLYQHNKVKKIVAVKLPKKRSAMHLDTVLTMLNHDCFTIYPPVIDSASSWEVIYKKNKLSINEIKINLFDYIGNYLQVNSIKLVPTGGDVFQMEREQWNDANNVLAIRPGVVVAYERNTHTIEKMCEAGITVHTIPGTELGRGRGGTRCMSCPIERDDF